MTEIPILFMVLMLQIIELEGVTCSYFQPHHLQIVIENVGDPTKEDTSNFNLQLQDQQILPKLWSFFVGFISWNNSKFKQLCHNEYMNWQQHRTDIEQWIPPPQKKNEEKAAT